MDSGSFQGARFDSGGGVGHCRGRDLVPVRTATPACSRRARREGGLLGWRTGPGWRCWPALLQWSGHSGLGATKGRGMEGGVGTVQTSPLTLREPSFWGQLSLLSSQVSAMPECHLGVEGRSSSCSRSSGGQMENRTVYHVNKTTLGMQSTSGG